MALLMLEHYVTFYKSLKALSWNVLCSLCSFKCYIGGKYAISSRLHRRWPSLSSIFRTLLFQCTWSSVLPNMLSCIEFLFQSVNRNFLYVNTKRLSCNWLSYVTVFCIFEIFQPPWNICHQHSTQMSDSEVSSNMRISGPCRTLKLLDLQY